MPKNQPTLLLHPLEKIWYRFSFRKYQRVKRNFVATPIGEDMVPPVNTHATGNTGFHFNPDGSLCYL
jgi:hypothetical protein